MADDLYLEPQFLIAVESVTTKSESAGTTPGIASDVISVATRTPLIYADTLVPAGAMLTIDCRSPTPRLTAIDTLVTTIPLQIAGPLRETIPCDVARIGLIWTKDEFRINSNRTITIDDNLFTAKQFTTSIQNGRGKVLSVNSDGNLTNLVVNNLKYFNQSRIIGQIQGRQYLLGYSNDERKITVFAANLDSLTIYDRLGRTQLQLSFTQSSPSTVSS
jgi:hypothetical protein